MAIELVGERHIDALMDIISPESWTSSSRRKMKVFDGAVPFWGSFVELIESWCPSLDGIYADAPCDSTGRLTNISVIGGNKDNTREFTFSKIIYLSRRRIDVYRGYVTKQFGKVDVYTDTGVIENGRPRLIKCGGIKKRDAANWMSGGMADWRVQEKEFVEFATVAPGLFFGLYHVWSVYFSVPGNISVRFPVDPHIALALFKDREKERGELRRKALAHWVRKHTRRSTTQDGVDIQVRKHIRGKTKFIWNGFDCVIQPDDDYIDSLSKGTTPKLING